MESLGGDQRWVDRFLAQASARMLSAPIGLTTHVLTERGTMKHLFRIMHSCVQSDQFLSTGLRGRESGRCMSTRKSGRGGVIRVKGRASKRGTAWSSTVVTPAHTTEPGSY
eukprot:246870-Pleurochrysis_carterae.AAC.1